VGKIEGCRIAALGLAYKADVDDLRESPAIAVVRQLGEAGAQVVAYEPYKPRVQISGITTVASPGEALQDADLVLLLAAHTPLKGISPAQAAAHMRGRIAVDAVNGWDAHVWEAAGFRLFRLGVGEPES
jgi:UDP-N-acetyl-D-mannosaminuronate dehydrogenase